MPTINSGAQGTGDVLAGQLVIQMGTKVFAYDPPGNPYTRVITKRMGSESAEATEVKWMEDEPNPYWDRLNEVLDASETAVDVDNGSYFKANDLIKVASTGEVMQVTSVSTNTLTVVRGYGSTSGTAAADNDYILNLTVAEEEGATAPSARATVKVQKTNYTQIVRTAVHTTETNKAVKHYHGDEHAYQLRKAGEEHAVVWEQIAFHGVKNEDTSGTHPRRSAGGLRETISTNTLAAGGVLTESEFVDWLGDVFRYSISGGRATKVAYFSQEIISTINSWGLAKLALNDKASREYGMDIHTYIAGSHRLNLVHHRLMENGYAGAGFVTDPMGTKYMPLRPTTLKTHIEEDGEDAQKDEYKTEATFKYPLEKVHGFVEGVSF